MSQSVGDLVVVLTLDKAQYSSQVKAAQRDLSKLGTTSVIPMNQIVRSTKGATTAIKGMKNETRSAQEAMMVLQGGSYQMAMAAGNLIGKSKALSSALEMAFPVIGAVAFGVVLYQIGDKVYQFMQQVDAMPDAIKHGFRDMNLSLQTNVDNMHLANDTLRKQIALIEHKPVNNLSIALDNAKKSSDKLATSLRSVLHQEDALLTKNTIGTLGSLVSANGSNTNVVGSLVSYHSQESQLLYKQQQAAHTGNLKQSDLYKKQLTDKLKSEIQWDTSRLQKYNAERTKVMQNEEHLLGKLFTPQIRAQVNAAQDKRFQSRVNAIQGDINIAYDSLDSMTSQANHDTLSNTYNKLHGDKTPSVKASKLLDLSYTGGSNPIEKLMQRHLLSKPVSNGYLGSKGFVRVAGYSDTPILPGPSMHSVALSGQTLSQIAMQKQQQDNTNAYERTRISAEKATGAISEYQAASKLAALHTKEFREQMQRLETAIRDVANSGMSAKAKQDATNKLNQTILALQGSRASQRYSDNASIYGNTIGGQAHMQLAQWMQHASNTPGQAGSTLVGGMNTVNSALSSSLTAHAYTGREYRRNIANSLAGAGRGIAQHTMGLALGHIEGGVLGKFLGGGKPDGTESKPLHVVIADGKGAMKSLGGNLHLGKLGKMLHLGGLAHLFQGFFADGGNVMANRPAIVGERGAELFVPRSAGTIISNHRLGGTTIHNHIDARGSTNPAETEAAVHRAMSHYSGPMANIAVAAQHQHNLRTPKLR